MRIDRQAIAALALVLGMVASAPFAADGDHGQLSGAVSWHESEWLMGDRLGWRGPWGTTYAGNLCLLADGITEEQWLELARNARDRPPMPWFALRDQDPQGPFVQFPAAPE